MAIFRTELSPAFVAGGLIAALAGSALTGMALDAYNTPRLGHAVSFAAVDGFQPKSIKFTDTLAPIGLGRDNKFSADMQVGTCIFKTDYTTELDDEGLSKTAFDYDVQLSSAEDVPFVFRVQSADELSADKLSKDYPAAAAYLIGCE